MNRKLFITLISLLAVLIAALLIRKEWKFPEYRSEIFSPLNLSFDSGSVKKIEMTLPKKAKDQAPKRDLEKVNGQWQVPFYWGVAADAVMVEKAFEKLKKLSGEFRSSDSALFRDFGVDRENAVSLKLWNGQGGLMLEILFSAKALSDKGTFMRVNSSEAVYFVPDDLRFLGVERRGPEIDFIKDAWLDPKPFQVSAGKVNALRVLRKIGGDEIKAASVQRIGKAWQWERRDLPFGFDAKKIETYLEMLQAWTASGWVNPEDPRGSVKNEASWTLQLSLEDGSVYSIAAFPDPASQGRFILKVSGAPVAYETSAPILEDLDIDDSFFAAENPFGIESEKVRRLKIHTPEKEWDILLTDTDFKARQILEEFKRVSIGRLVWDAPKQEAFDTPGPYFLEIDQTGKQEPLVLDTGYKLSGNQDGYVAKIRGNAQAFILSEVDFKALFGQG